MRPLLGQAVIVIRTTLSLRAEDDADLVAAFARIEPRHYAAFIKLAMRSGCLLDFEAEAGQDDEDLSTSLAGFMD